MPSTGKHPNSFAIYSRSLHWSIFVSEPDSSCCHRFGFGGDLVRNRSVMPLGSQTVTNGRPVLLKGTGRMTGKLSIIP
jgi:hypothetical protein